MDAQNTLTQSKSFRLKDPGSAITHFIGMILSIIGAFPLIIKVWHGQNQTHMVSFILFIMSMILLYAASATYHSFDLSEKTNQILRKLDHCMIFILIAGSYTPICTVVLAPSKGYMLLGVVWTIALLGIFLKLYWITAPKWLSSVIYIGMGWACILAFSDIYLGLSTAAFGWLLAGGIIYTIGGIIYALKMPLFNTKHQNFGSHEVFHLFVMGGSLCHFILMYQFLA